MKENKRELAVCYIMGNEKNQKAARGKSDWRKGSRGETWRMGDKITMDRK